ncbi:hypothetical protein GXN76_11335 [Kroppenstedtia pulmonis]|uniref:Uncharacterized protein n=1 Tax=Kroppenstedtia pulmonis TaxID=1380685 RepID=A0A7D3Y5M7_9BACL|nr:hypothetical protein [Kroppenstedtia pulmonis]QKG85005.1 hypothetical protein GXN76_11335 [Kroppenstedtia pulmonis]
MSKFRWKDRSGAIEEAISFVKLGYSVEEAARMIVASDRFSTGSDISDLQLRRYEADVEKLAEERMPKSDEDDRQESEEYIPAWIRLRR